MTKHYQILTFVLSMGALLSLFSCQDQVEHDLSASKQMEKVYSDYSSVKIENGNISLTLEEFKKEAEENLIQFTSRYKSAKDVSGGYDVGVIPVAAGCPLSSELVSVLLNTERDTPHESYHAGSPISWYKDVQDDVIMYFCKVDGRLFTQTGGGFTLVRFGPNVPESSAAPLIKILQGSLRIDLEDGNGYTRLISPTTAATAAPLYIDNNKNLVIPYLSYLIPGNVPYPDLGFSYAVFGGYVYGQASNVYQPKFGGSAVHNGQWYIDTEDDGDNSGLVYHYGPHSLEGDKWTKFESWVKVKGGISTYQGKGIKLFYNIVR